MEQAHLLLDLRRVPLQQRPAFAVRSLEDSLRRLGTDHVDLYQLHINELPVPAALDLVGTLEDLVGQSKIRAYGWSTDDPASAEAFAAAGAYAEVERLLTDLRPTHAA
ncbi:hypothetical protein GCM10027614_28140 [Micromonospora vulcania]